jgi:hypothetical protein
MITNKTKDIVSKIRTGEIDINDQSLFFPIVIRGLLLQLNKYITIRGIKVPHYILHTGDDIMYLMNKGQDSSIEPLEISNEDYIYSTVPRCIVNPGSLDVVPDQLTNPYSRGNVLFESEDNIYPLMAEFRRMPVKFQCGLKYYVDSNRDMMELIQQVISKLSFVRTYYITYMGQSILCSYKLPESFNGEHLTDLDGTTSDNKYRTLELDVEIESNFPIFDAGTVMWSGSIINFTPKSDKDLKYGSVKSAGSVIVNGAVQIGTDWKEYVKTGNLKENDVQDAQINMYPKIIDNDGTV